MARMTWRRFTSGKFRQHQRIANGSGLVREQSIEALAASAGISDVEVFSRERPNEASKSVDWEQWWQDQIAGGEVHWFRAGLIQAPLVRYRNRCYDVANSGLLLREIMFENGLRTVLCAGSGISREPARLADGGFDVTALDLSPTAIRLAKSLDLQDWNKRITCG